MRISDWSSDVCSSDLEQDAGDIRPGFEHASDQSFRPAHGLAFVYALAAARVEKAEPPGTRCRRTEIGRASCRERGCQYVYISGVSESLKKNQQATQPTQNLH